MEIDKDSPSFHTLRPPHAKRARSPESPSTLDRPSKKLLMSVNGDASFPVGGVSVNINAGGNAGAWGRQEEGWVAQTRSLTLDSALADEDEHMNLDIDETLPPSQPIFTSTSAPPRPLQHVLIRPHVPSIQISTAPLVLPPQPPQPPQLSTPPTPTIHSHPHHLSLTLHNLHPHPQHETATAQNSSFLSAPTQNASTPPLIAPHTLFPFAAGSSSQSPSLDDDHQQQQQPPVIHIQPASPLPLPFPQDQQRWEGARGGVQQQQEQRWESSAQQPQRRSRFTMGPRVDCEKCRAGIKGHWMHFD